MGACVAENDKPGPEEGDRRGMPILTYMCGGGCAPERKDGDLGSACWQGRRVGS